jgi:hypothetical protein
MTRPALAIANANGLPGTAGLIVVDAEGARAVLTNHHVVFAGGAAIGDRVWALPSVTDGHDPADVVCLGRTRAGRIGRITFTGETCFVDCALVRMENEELFPTWLIASLADLYVTEVANAEPGLPVIKCGATTGLTAGMIADVAYPDHPYIGDRWWKAPGQLLIDSRDGELNFSAAGDSGAAVLDEQGRVVGLLWGSNANGQGISCPIAPVLDCLGATLMTMSEPMPRSV